MPRALMAWILDAVYREELEALVAPCGLSLEEMRVTLEPLINNPLKQDEQMLIRAFTDEKTGGVYAASLLNALCGSPHYRVTKVLVGVGLDLHQLENKIGETPA